MHRLRLGLGVGLVLWFAAPLLFTSFCLNLSYIVLLQDLPDISAATRQMFDRCARWEGESGRSTLAQAQAAYVSGDHPAALTHFSRALELGQSWDIVHWRLGTLYADNGDTSSALTHWQAMGAATYFYESGIALRHRNDWRGAEKALRQAVVLDSTNANRFRSLGEFYLEWGKPEDADRQFQRALELETAPFEKTLIRGLRFQISGETQAAEQHFRAAILLEPARPEAYRRLADLLTQSNQPLEAIAVLVQGTEHASMPFSLYLRMGQLLSEQGDFVNADHALERAERFDSHSDESWLWRGQNALAWGNLTMAETYLDRALALDASNPETHYWKGRILARLERCSQARAEYARAVEISPDEPRYTTRQALSPNCP